MATLYLCGAGNPEGVRLALSVTRSTGLWDDLVLLDDDPSLHGREVLGIPIEGSFEVLADADPARDRVVNLVARTTAGRRAARARIEEFGVPFTPLIAPDIDLLGTDLPRDIIVYPGGYVGADSVVGDGSVVFMGAIVGHGARVGRCCVLAPGAVINARVRLGDEVYVGTNASVLPELTLGDGVKVGTGSVVLTDVAAGSSVLGVPAETLYVEGDANASRGGGGGRVRPHEDRHGDLEEVVAGVWCEVLGVEDVARQHNFFDMGGRSIDAAEVCRLLGERLDVDIQLTDLFRYTTVRALARHLADEAGGNGRPSRAHEGESPATRGANRAEKRKRSPGNRRDRRRDQTAHGPGESRASAGA